MFDNQKIKNSFLLLKTINRMSLDNIFLIFLSCFLRAILKNNYTNMGNDKKNKALQINICKNIKTFQVPK